MARHEIWEMKQMQSLSLKTKIAMTVKRIKDWVNEYSEDGVYVSFSGGKDSTVLLHIVREVMGLKDVPAVFVDTGLEYPEIREFVKGFENVVWLKPKMNFRQVIDTYGYPFISKEVARTVKGAKKGQRTRIEKLNGTYRMKNGEKSFFQKTKWKFLLDAPFEIDSYCCDIMKKNPTKAYETKTGRKPILAQMAEESRQRLDAWLHTGCNAFDIKRPQSNPMAFWTEQDVLHYIKEKNIPICSVYGEIVADTSGVDDVDGQYSISDVDPEVFKDNPLPLKTSKCSRTGCMFCGFGCYFADDYRFRLLKTTHPTQYDYIMRPVDKGGLNYKGVIDWINEHGKLNIRY